MFLSIIGFSLLVPSTEFSQNMAFAAVKTNSTNMMITDTDTKIMMNANDAYYPIILILCLRGH